MLEISHCTCLLGTLTRIIYAVGVGYADVALVRLFVTFRHHPIFSQFLLFFS